MGDDSSNNGHDWYILCHLNPKTISVLLKKENEGEFWDKQNNPPSPFKFFIPYLYAPTAELRGDFRRFVFVQASPQRVDEIIHSKWNNESRLRLFYYRHHDGTEVVASDRDVRNLIQMFQDENLNFYIDKPIDEFAPDDKVIINTGPWAGYEGHILEIKVKNGRAKMKVGLNVFNLVESIVFTDFKTGDVIFKDSNKAQLMSNNPIAQFEEEVINILSHKYGKVRSADIRESDARKLRQLAAFDRILVEETDDDYYRFLSLRLICASLRGTVKKVQLLDKVRHYMSGKTAPSTDAEAYMMVALFIATKNVDYRTALKEYRTSHPDAPDILRRYQSIIKKMRAKSHGNI